MFPLWYRSLPPEIELKNLIVWVKDNHTAGDLKGNFGFKWEGIMMLTKGRHLLRGHRWSNVWDFSRVSSSDQVHPAEKPVELLQRIVESSSDPDDLVVDPYCGAGSLGEAALYSNRRALLADIDPRIVRTAKKRMGYDVENLSTPTTPEHEREVELDRSPLEGVHPEDIAYLA